MSYIVPVHRPSGVRHALKLHFLSPAHDTLVVAKANRLERLQPAASATDHLFVGTDRYQYFTCSWDAAARQIKTEQSYVDQADKVLRSSRDMDRAHVDPTRRFMTLELYDGIVTTGTLGEPAQVRIEELLVRSSAFVQTEPNSTAPPRLAMLWEDNHDDPQLKVRELRYSAAADQPSASLRTVAELRKNLDPGVSHVIPVAAPYGGFLLLGEASIAYADSDLKRYFSHDLEDQSTLWTCWTQVDDLRYLLADDYGSLYFIMIETDFQGVVSWRLDRLGTVPRASCLVYLDAGCVFVGSFSGDSQLVRIVEAGVDVLQTLANIAPILDLAIMDLGRGTDGVAASDFSTGQARIVAACGAWQDGSIRGVRSGVSIDEIAFLTELPNITDLWALNTGGAPAGQHDTIVLAFVDETKVLRLEDDSTLEELDQFNDFDLTEPTLLAANVADLKAVQVSETGVRVVDLELKMLLMEWQPSDQGAKITAAASSSVHLLVVEAGHSLHLFRTDTNDAKPAISKTFSLDSQISSVTVPESQAKVCVVSFWQTASVAVLDLHSLETVFSQSVGVPGADIPRSVLVANILPDSPPTLFVAMLDGTVLTFAFDLSKLTLSNMARILLGSEPVFFKLLPRDRDGQSGLCNVFASCEQPSLIYSAEGRIVYSAVSYDKVSRVCYFNSASYADAIAIATPTELTLANIGTERATQLQTLALHQTVRCVAYDASAKLFEMGCIRRQLEDGNEMLCSSVKIADEVTFKELDSVDLEPAELVECIVPTGRFETEDDTMSDMFVVGTSILHADDEPSGQDSRGRIIVFEVNPERKIKQVTEARIKGACRSLAMCDGKIVAGVVKAVVLYGLAPSKSRGRHSLELRKLGSHSVSSNPLSLAVTPSTPTTPAIIAVADLIKSLTVIEVHASSKSGPAVQLKEVSRHFASLWSSSCTAIGDNEWLLADMDGNLCVLKRNLEGVTGDDRRRLQTTGEFRLGEVVNKTIPIHGPGSDSQPAVAAKGKARERTISSTAAARSDARRNGGRTGRSSRSGRSSRTGPIITPKAFLATVEGAIYMYGNINPPYQDVLLRLQAGLADIVQGPGYMPWAKYRAWKTETREENEPFRFVDGDMVEQCLLNLTDAQLTIVLRQTGLADRDGLSVSLHEARAWGEELRRLY
ncbi:hypothetical protein DV736_g2266, partial [Chaetothyriales sp. CBS 134916]